MKCREYQPKITPPSAAVNVTFVTTVRTKLQAGGASPDPLGLQLAGLTRAIFWFWQKILTFVPRIALVVARMQAKVLPKAGVGA